MPIRREIRFTWKSALLPFGMAALLTAMDVRASDAVVLNPGWMTGVVQLSPGVTITSGTLYAYSNDGYQASKSLTGAPYTLTVEGGRAYRPHVYLNVDNGSANSYMYLNIYNNEPTMVAVGETVTRDIVRNVANLSGSVNVVGGTVNRLRVWASAYSPAPNESYYAEGYYYDESFSVPMVLDDAVTVSGVVDVTRDDGVSLQVPLASQSVMLGPGGHTVDWPLDLGALSTGAIGGTIGVGNFPALSQHWIHASGSNAATQGVGVSTTLLDDGPYSLAGLVPGAYWVYAYSYFDAPYGLLVHSPAYTNVTVAAGATTALDYGGPTAFLRGTLELNGLRRNTDDMSWGAVYARGYSEGYGYDSVALPGGEFDLALVAGDWRLGHYSASFYHSGAGAPSLHLNANFETRNNAVPVTTLAAGDDLPGNKVSVTTTETLLVFDVAEPPNQAEIRISDARVEGYVSGFPGYKRFYAYGLSLPTTQSSVRVVAEPGTYQVACHARVGGSMTEFKNFTLELPPPTPLDATSLPSGEIFPSPSLNLTVDFLNGIPAPGYITATALPMGPKPPLGYKLAEGAFSSGGLYYDVMTNVEGSQMLVCLPYDDTVIPDDVAAATLRPWHYVVNQSGFSGWQDLWNGASSEEALAEGLIRPVENRICGITPSFSIFAVMQLADSDGDGVVDVDDNCPEVSNDGQDDIDGDGLGDACDDDNDGDGVLNDIDLCPLASDPSQFDLDGDGLGDACDDDDDDDGVPDAADNCPGVPNDQADLDGDGLGDACEDDIDGDGTSDAGDNCPLAANSDQGDLDGDGNGDACDDDTDGDGVPNVIDLCPLAADPSQADLDGDGAGDACDGDDDADGIPDIADNCAGASNTGQADLDGDGLGDVCDPDDDGDGLDDAADNCPLAANAGQADLDGDGAGDACDGDDDGDGTPDGDDECPASQGADADQDGCADQASDLCALVQSMSLPQGVTSSLCAKATAAATSSGANAANLLDVFIQQVEQQRSRKIPSDQADLLVAFAHNAQASLPQ